MKICYSAMTTKPVLYLSLVRAMLVAFLGYQYVCHAKVSKGSQRMINGPLIKSVFYPKIYSALLIFTNSKKLSHS